MNKESRPILFGSLYGFGTGYAGNVWDSDAISPTLQTMQGGGRQPHILVNDTEHKDKTSN